MRKILLLGLMMVSFNLLNAQTQVDIVTGAGYTNEVYYSMENGEVSSSPRNNWDIAFVTQVMNISILINKGSYLNDGIGAELYTYRGGGISAWNTLDTTGMEWIDMYNDYESFDNGAFTMYTVAGDYYDFGWGRYNEGNHKITGDSLFVIKTLGGTYKKLWIVEKAATTNSWIFKYANLDGSDEQEISFNANDYKTKNFIYYSIDEQKFVDREPASDSWDLVCTNWGILLNYGGMPFPQGVTGVLSNEYANIKTLEVQKEGMQQDTAVTYDKNMFTTNISNIGYGWKKFNNTELKYTVSDSTVYYIKKQVDNTATYWKIYFTAFDYMTGTYSFMQEQMEQAVSTGPDDMVTMVEIFPNPATDYITLVYDASASVDIDIYDTSGKLVYSEMTGESGFSKHRVDVSALKNGIYFVNVRSGNKTGSLKFIKE